MQHGIDGQEGRGKDNDKEDIFSILSDKGEQQVLQICLSAGKTIYFKGKVLYSTALSNKRTDWLPNRFTLQAFLNFPIIFNQLTNTSSQLQTMAATHQTLTGPLLLLDLDIYHDSFYINYLNLVASTSQLQIRQRATLSNYFILFQQKTEAERKVARDKRRLDMHAREGLKLDQRSKMVLQSNGPIVEKYLGVGEEFVLFDGENLMAYSKTVRVERLGGHNGLGFAPAAVLQFKGPGWMFFTTKLGGERRKQRQIAMGNLFLMMFLAINVLLIFLPLL